MLEKFWKLLIGIVAVWGTMIMPMNAKTLVAYFSATGTTKAAAEKLAQQHDAQLWEIEPAEKYTAADLDWRNPEKRFLDFHTSLVLGFFGIINSLLCRGTYRTA